ncbi:MAG: hypothetical protein ACYTXY_12990, partial [Nostoc sp.]
GVVENPPFLQLTTSPSNSSNDNIITNDSPIHPIEDNSLLNSFKDAGQVLSNTEQRSGINRKNNNVGIPNTNVQLIPKTPVEPTPTILVQPIPTIPVEPTPIIPVQPIPIIPVKPIPTIPVEPIPIIPVESIPIIPVKPIPQKPTT